MGGAVPIIAVLNPKGGSGKTTLTTNLARALHEKGEKVLIVDSDPQGSARDWHAADDNNPLSLIALDRANAIKSLTDVAKTYGFVLIDGAAKLEDMIAASIKVADIVLIPVTPSPYDLWAATDLVDFIKARQAVTDGVPRAAFIISRAISGTRLGGEIVAALEEHGLPVFETTVVQRQIYPQSASEGGTVFDAKNFDAREEIERLADEMLAFAAMEAA